MSVLVGRETPDRQQDGDKVVGDRDEGDEGSSAKLGTGDHTHSI